jgi:hypothetical protein
MGEIVTKEAEEGVPAVEAVDNVDDASGYLSREIRELGGETVNHQQTEERLCDGLAQAAKLCGKTMDTRAVLHSGFSWKHVGLGESGEYGHHSSTGCGLVSVHQILEHGYALVRE